VLDTDAGTLRFGRNGIMLERVISNVPPGVSFVVAGCNTAFDVVKFDDGIEEKKKAVAIQRKAKYEVASLDRVSELEADASHAISKGDTRMALDLISTAMVECSNSGEAGAAKAAELEQLRLQAQREALERAQARSAESMQHMQHANHVTMLLSSVSLDDWHRGHSVRGVKATWSATAHECAEAVRECVRAGPIGAGEGEKEGL